MTEIASVHRRFCAYLIDVAILLIPTLLIVLSLGDFSLILHLSCMCINCGYFTYFISSTAQATPGQQLMNIYTITLDSSKIGLSLAFDRTISQFFLPMLNNSIITFIKLFQTSVNALSTLEVIIVMLTFSWYLVACFSQRKQAFHDVLFDTIVVRKMN
ncbi:RDD family protein [Wolbachia endosymbiont of Diaphorina citri]|jgi:Predicted membrane protein/domain|uniref:RDD family protein n=1 Tax=Wolbachia endosymbiont of Diaphorina citri TaxID=116598 RepID=UPI00030CCB8F|nr:RDD family protein [Wolbachia endosymbiont of Diaphorina citri]QJT94011.1 RDD family protein [Wolbachia endosymbiont of Diaphorina citri]QJT95252.1 RDD family protein [Wolbachia endosymbiont of Diaphorina citri]QJT96498.1 RDD family protein [Wolbachia endosymbiont of Diaphorina citri]QLK10908.1 RDD family protein [Wolbachia endosymbiont of Diaphorina citri]QXY86578.1 RDD family protein [Wolbachia endosymbiont of Diaphorina citri]